MTTVAHDPLEHEKRQQILQLIEDYPGMYYHRLIRNTGMSPGIVQYHLRVLERAGLVVSEQHGLQRLYFRAGRSHGLTVAKYQPLLRSELAARMAAVLATRGDATQNELAFELGVDRSIVSYHLRRLVQAQLVVTVTVRPKRYAAAPVLREVLARRNGEPIDEPATGSAGA